MKPHAHTLLVTTGLVALVLSVAACHQKGENLSTSPPNTSSSGVDGGMAPASDAGASPGSAPSDAASAAGAGSMSGGVPSSASPPASGSSSLNDADRQFLVKAAQANLFEMRAGQLAAGRANDPEVKSLAFILAQDHTAANARLGEIATRLKVDLPTAVSAAQERELHKLSGISGSAFDQEFVKAVGLDDHRTDIANYEKIARQAANESVRELALSLLPTLRAHLSVAQNLPVGVRSPGTSS